MKPTIRADELFVVEALCASHYGTWRPGEDPPDVYMCFNSHEVAIEISTLTQHVFNDCGVFTPRLSQDSGVLSLCDELNETLALVIPADMYIILTLTAPLTHFAKIKNKLIAELEVFIQGEIPNERKIELYGNAIKISLVAGRRRSGKKVIGIVANQNSTPDILLNARNILNDRINIKTRKCSKITHRPLWLALLNDYWLAEPNIYKQAMHALSLKHSFDKICLVLSNKTVHTLYEK